MTDYTTIRVSQDTLDTAKESKAEDETWNEYLLRCHDEGQPDKLPPVTLEATEIEAIGNEVEKRLR